MRFIKPQTEYVEAQTLKVGDVLIEAEDGYQEKITDIKEDKDGNLEIYVITEYEDEPIYVVSKTSKREKCKEL